ncbi:MAG: Hsp20/alpha crystallin family protein [Acidobacteriota bacterium]
MASQFPILYSPTRTLRSVDPFLDLSRQMNRMMDNFFPGASTLMGVGASALTESMPRIDVQEDKQEICITAEIPGINAADVDVRVDGDLITICGEKRTQNETSLDSYRVMERSYGSFHRTVPLPFTPDPQQIQAEYKQGLLTIHVPKQAQLDVSQRIPVRDSSEGSQNGQGQSLNASRQQSIEGMTDQGQSQGEETEDPTYADQTHPTNTMSSH